MKEIKIRLDEKQIETLEKYKIELSDNIPEVLEWNIDNVTEAFLNYAINLLNDGEI